MKKYTLLTLCLAVTAFAQGAPPAAKPAAAPAPTAAAPAVPAAAATWKEGLATPESVFYDRDTDTYLVSNIKGKPLDKDDNGYIAELSPDGKVVTAKLVEGGQKGVKLNAPKGMAVLDGVLYVADIDTVRLFDRKTGEAKGEVALKGATFANDIAVGPDKKLYVTDSGLNPEFKPTGTDAIWVITPGKKPSAKAFVKGKELKGPNGIFVTADTVYVVTFGSNELFEYDLKGKKKGEGTKLPTGGLDGLEKLGDDLLISSWEGKAVYRGKPGAAFTAVVSNVEAPADIGFDAKRNRVLIPRFMGDQVEAWDVK